MDFSSLPEDQQKQLQQLHQQFQEHQQQQQQHHHQQQQQIHDYAAQSYDPSYYAYYQSQDPQQSQQYSQYHQPEQQQQQQYHQNYASYYSDYANAHHQRAQQQHSQVDAALSHPQQGVPAGEMQNPAGYGAPLGLNPAAAAAVAALSQLAQFAGTMEAAEKAIALVGLQARGGVYGQTIDPASGQMHHGPPFHSPGGQSPYRGGRSFRGTGRGNFGNHSQISGGEGNSFHGRGRGRGRAARGRFPADGAASSSHPKPSAQAPVLPKQGNPVHIKRPPQPVRCELCRVDCNTVEILELHKNGKKHKKNLQKAGKAAVPEPVVDSIPQVASHPETVQVGNAPQQETPTTESVDNGGTRIEAAVQENDKAKVPETALRSNDQMRGKKRKTKGGGRGGGKRAKPLDTARPSKPKVVIPLICDLCNVRCDTQEVFDIHLAGKKHISKLKRFQGHQAMYGPSGLHALYPPNPIAQTLLIPQGPPQQTAHNPQVSYPPPPPEPYVPPQVHYSAEASSSGFQHNIGYQVPGPTPYSSGQVAAQQIQ